MSSDALEQGVKIHNELQNLVDTGPPTFEDMELAVQQIKDLPNRPPALDIYHPTVAALLEQSIQQVRVDCRMLVGKNDLLCIPEDYSRLLERSLLSWPIPLHEDTEEERIRRSLAFHEFFPKPLPAHLWLLTDPPYEATDPDRRCWRVKLRLLPVYLQKQLRRRKRRRNHA